MSRFDLEEVPDVIADRLVRSSRIGPHRLVTRGRLSGMGLALSTRALGRKPRPAWLFDLHRFLGGIALVFTGVHVGAILLDTYVHFSLVNVLIPFTGSWHPAAVAWGIVALYLLVAVELTSLARSRISKRLWRNVHYGSFALFVVSTAHGLTAGTDRHSLAFVLFAVAVCGVVVVLTALRIARSVRPSYRVPALDRL